MCNVPSAPSAQPGSLLERVRPLILATRLARFALAAAVERVRSRVDLPDPLQTVAQAAVQATLSVEDGTAAYPDGWPPLCDAVFQALADVPGSA